ncbi:MAG: GrpB family protein [bacterium]|nr:GrpB family protein [bacterium]
MALQRGIVELENYNKKWKEDYESEKKLLEDVLGDKIIEIHHIGSTSIDGLMAKPVIDILIVIKSLNEINQIEEILKDYDYENRGQQVVSDRFFFAKGPEIARSHYIHFTEPNSNTYYNQVYFKRYLIEHPEYIKKYCDLKQVLAEKYADERPKYTQGKNEFITEVIRLAKEEYND